MATGSDSSGSAVSVTRDGGDWRGRLRRAVGVGFGSPCFQRIGGRGRSQSTIREWPLMGFKMLEASPVDVNRKGIRSSSIEDEKDKENDGIVWREMLSCVSQGSARIGCGAQQDVGLGRE